MLFNSLEFGLFLPVVFFLYWFVFKNKLRQQNFLVVFASYFFYGWWDWRFLCLIFVSTIVDFLIGKKLFREEKASIRKRLLWISLFVNLGMLGVFKYYNFFVASFNDAFTFLGAEINLATLNILLPVGISFYTFQTLSYTIDIYRKKLTPANEFTTFAAFVSFFPQLVAGPIERATSLLPQFKKRRTFDYSKAIDGSKQILWGAFKKVVIADNCAEYANLIFNNAEGHSGSTLALGAIFFSFQIYGDFSGYSDMAIGLSRLFGFDLKQNFAFPYFSRNIGEFWRRWHISLSSWFRDYLYIPLGGSRVGKMRQVINTLIIFLVSGFWHGPNWTFVCWGGLHALYFIPLLLFRQNRKYNSAFFSEKIMPSLRECTSMSLTFVLVTFAWILFRADSLNSAFNYIGGIFSSSFFSVPDHYDKMIVAFVLLFILIEWIGRHGEYGLQLIGSKASPLVRHALYILIILMIVLFGGVQQEFIYFQF